MMNLQLASLMLFAPDLDRATVFYRDVLGMTVTARTERQVTLSVGGIALDIFRCGHSGAAGNYANEPRSVFVFGVADIEAALAHLRSHGVTLIHAVPVLTEQSRYAAFVDPFGNVHELAQPR